MAYEFHEDRPVNESGGAEVSGGLVRGGRGAGAGPEQEFASDGWPLNQPSGRTGLPVVALATVAKLKRA
jgi:hypothetical protein